MRSNSHCEQSEFLMFLILHERVALFFGNPLGVDHSKHLHELGPLGIGAGQDENQLSGLGVLAKMN